VLGYITSLERAAPSPDLVKASELLAACGGNELSATLREKKLDGFAWRYESWLSSYRADGAKGK
jgi:hypothetical protein